MMRTTLSADLKKKTQMSLTPCLTPFWTGPRLLLPDSLEVPAHVVKSWIF